MAKKLYDKEINKSVDWGGDESTNNLPVSGNRVQEFIKDSLNKRIGILYYDTNSNRYLCFADEQSKDEYIENPTLVDLVLGTFDAPFNYTAEINLITPSYNAVFLGTAGNYIRFTYDIKNKQGSSTGEDVVVTYTFVRNSIKQVVTETKKSGEIVSINIDKYIGEGANSITVSIRGRTTLAATLVNVTFQVVNLQISDQTDITKAHDLSKGSKILEIPFSVSGYGSKIVEWYLDGDLLPYDKIVDEVVDASTSRTKYITLSGLSQGLHSLQIRAYTVINGERFYSDVLYRDLIIHNGVGVEDVIAIMGVIPTEYGVITPEGDFKLYGMTQYVPYELSFATFSPTSKESVNVDVFLGGELMSNVSSKNGVLNNVSIVSPTSGNKTVLLKSGSLEYSFDSGIAETTMNISEINAGLKIDFNGVGKSNGSSNRNVWEQGGYSAKFNGFNWNSTSGWADNKLLISNGASLDINYAPLAGDVTSMGRTLEFEFKTTNVSDDNTIICDLRNSAGVGLVIYATKVVLRSQNGSEIQNEFKSDELVRMSIVINKKRGAVNKMLSFIYTNGIVSRGINWIDTDNYTSDKMISFKGSATAQVELKQIRIYEDALSNDQLLNNYILYREDVNEMVDVYERNDVYLEGTNTLAPEKMSSRVPVMIFTGNIPVLEATQNKNTQIIVDIEYINMQNPELSFNMKNAALRPQGTSSMAYPKKNFRIYTNKVTNTIVYDYLGNIIENKLYSFTKNAQPVDCWCLKADYAESSGTHNTGVARIWNDILYESQLTDSDLEDKHVFRTEAQKKAIESGYKYDVRTTIDGFPILVFYRLTPNDDLVFIGKYNFNNDKSTEAVFGFENIPGFNNAKMQCWEVLNNGHPLTLFTDISSFDTQWDKAWESRYPDSKNPSTLADLKRFSQWMAGVNGDHARFATEKWDRFNVYNVAAYYSYMMRFGAVDQVAKNVFLTSEDGEKYYFINYDNDTILGVANTGDLIVPPDIDRQSKDSSGNYIYAAHDSVMWNMFEADEEFMALVPIVDNALTTAGLTYNNVITLFNDKQADYWVERVYNQDAQYKYIGLFTQSNVNNLYMMQGKRDLHRKWWLAKRFSIYDSKWVSGDYRSKAITLKCQIGTPIGQTFKVTAGSDLDYGYGINSGLRETGITLKENESHSFVINEGLNTGDVVRIFGSTGMKELDLSAMAGRLENVTVTDAWVDHLGSRLERLIVGRLDANNLELPAISGLGKCKYLRELNVEGLKAITALDLRGLLYIETVKAKNSGIASIALEKGAPVKRLELPNGLNTLILEQLPYLTTDNLIIGNSIKTIRITGSAELSSDFDFVYNWYTNKSEADKNCSFTMDDINWQNIDSAQLLEFLNIAKVGGEINLKGRIHLLSATLEVVDAIKEAIGEYVFQDGGDLKISAPDSVFLTGPTEILEGQKAQFSGIVFSENMGDKKYSIISGSRSGVVIDAETGELTTVENGIADTTLTIRFAHMSTENEFSATTKEIKIKKRVYPTSSNITLIGNYRVEEQYTTYNLLSTVTPTGDISVEWVLSGEAVDWGYLTVYSSDEESCVVSKLKNGDNITATLTVNIIKTLDGSVIASKSTSLIILNPNIAVSRAVNPEVMTILFNNGLSINKDFMLKSEAALITDAQLGTIFKGSNIKTFNEFKYFTGITNMQSAFERCRSLVEAPIIPESVTNMRDTFSGCRSLTSIPVGIFDNCVNVTTFNDTFSGCDSLTSIPVGLFDNCVNATDFSWCFTNCYSVVYCEIPMLKRYAKLDYYVTTNALRVLVSNSLTPPRITRATISNNTDLKIYVPDESITAYKTASTWVTYESQIYPLSEYENN